MISFYLLLLLCAAHSHGNRIAVCIESEDHTECPSLKATDHVTCCLSNVSQIVGECKEVEIYLAKGRHFLHKLLTFSKVVTKLKIHGESSEYPSTVLCHNAGIRFGISMVSAATLNNLAFESCGSEQNIPRRKILVALNFNGSVTLENVTIANASGMGVFAHNGNVTIRNCKFIDSTEGLGHVNVTFTDQKIRRPFFVNITGTIFHKGSSSNWSGGLDVYTGNKHVDLNISISHCKFSANTGRMASHAMIEISNDNFCEVLFTNCTFFEGKGRNDTYGVFLHTKKYGNQVRAILNQCRFISNAIGGLRISHIQHIEVNNNSIRNNIGSGLSITKYAVMQEKNRTLTIISNTHFSNNLQALYLIVGSKCYSECSNPITQVVGCNFTSHRSSAVMHMYAEGDPDDYEGIEVRLQGLNFERNYNAYNNCSTLLLQNLNSVVLEDLSFYNNNCTGITLVSSDVKVRKSLNLTGNRAISGGGLRLEKSPARKLTKVVLDENTRLNIIGNRANRYGGGIFADQTCNDDPDCFFQFDGAIPQSPVLNLAGNQAELGGDAIFGGCLSNCFFNLLENSSSTIAHYPTKVVFCETGTCATNHSLEAYRGEQFRISLMAVDDSCIPSVDFMETRRKEPDGTGGAGSYQRTKKHCDSYSFTMKANSKTNLVTMELFLQRVGLSHSAPTILTVNLQDCPIGFKLDETTEECGCNDLLASTGIQCTASTHSLKVPAYTWIGGIDGREAINEYCQYCQKGRDVTIHKITGSQELCFSPNRTGILCGQCVAGFSLQLGGYKCADCSNSAYKGVLLVIGFGIIGIVMVMVLLGLNLTVSTGLMSGMIFYSNIVHSNSDLFLPIHNYRNSSLDYVVRLLSTFQAWINLDFGIVTCFFDGYDTYISTWMQFVFPLYIWLLILIIVLASRYSRRISALTASNTVSVLATLLLLSYAKLLNISLEAVSYTDAEYLDDSSKYRIWILDGNIPYLQGKHIPLFLISLLTTMIYILPFTLLILLGPLLQAKSHYRVLNWINKLKPFLDAF